MLEVYDTAGQEDYVALRNHYISCGEGFLLVFSLTSRQSFLACYNTYRTICKVKETEAPVVALVGNKKDLVKTTEVSKKEINEFCAKHNCVYLATSAFTGDGVNDVFVEITRLVHSKMQKAPRSSFRCNLL
jgi:GTPase KRas protein